MVPHSAVSRIHNDVRSILRQQWKKSRLRTIVISSKRLASSRSWSFGHLVTKLSSLALTNILRKVRMAQFALEGPAEKVVTSACLSLNLIHANCFSLVLARRFQPWR